jgi:peptidoglycan/xylan/chitin deacetylase (PgdA/CDA1 family)
MDLMLDQALKFISFERSYEPKYMSKYKLKPLIRSLSSIFFCIIMIGCAEQPVLSAQDVVMGLPSMEEKDNNSPSSSLVIATTPSPDYDNNPLPLLTPTTILTPEPTQSGVWTGSGEVTAPILLYHHVSDQKRFARYSVSVAQFRLQMDLLKKLGYQTISISEMVNAVNDGAYLPEKPVIITFDDGPEDVYATAYPIMKAYGFFGTIFIVGDYLDAAGFLSVNEIKELHKAGWEVGSHSMSHANLYQAPSLSEEILKSRKYLSERTGLAISSFAYPFGVYNEFLAKKVVSYGYQAAVGLGWTNTHNPESLYYLSRIEVKRSLPLYSFNSKLPWKMSSDRFIELYPD